jgi:hypothetical protein
MKDRRGLTLTILNIILFYLLLYLFKILITIQIRNRLLSVLLYLALFVVSLVFLYSQVENGPTPHQDIEYYWYGTPVVYLTIPTITFIYDVIWKKKSSILLLIVRSLIEIFVITPVWAFFAIYFIFGVFLQWVRI